MADLNFQVTTQPVVKSGRKPKPAATFNTGNGPLIPSPNTLPFNANVTPSQPPPQTRPMTNNLHPQQFGQSGKHSTQTSQSVHKVTGMGAHANNNYSGKHTASAQQQRLRASQPQTVMTPVGKPKATKQTKPLTPAQQQKQAQMAANAAARAKAKAHAAKQQKMRKQAHAVHETVRGVENILNKGKHYSEHARALEKKVA